MGPPVKYKSTAIKPESLFSVKRDLREPGEDLILHEKVVGDGYGRSAATRNATEQEPEARHRKRKQT